MESQQTRDSVLYNYLYNRIIKNKYYILRNVSVADLANNVNISRAEVVPTLTDLNEKCLIKYNKPYRSISLPYSVSKLDHEHHELDPNFKYDPHDVVRTSFLTMMTNSIYRINKLNSVQKKLLQEITNVLESAYFQKIGNLINKSMKAPSGSMSTFLKTVDNVPYLAMHFQFSYVNVHVKPANLRLPMSNVIDFTLTGQNQNDLNDQINKLKHYFKQD